MRKSKPLVAGKVSVIGRRPVVRVMDDGVIAVPIPAEQRPSADADMKDFIRQHKQKEKLIHK